MPDPKIYNNICPSCGHANDSVRVYCQECGAKLNPPPVAAAAPISSAQIKRKRTRSYGSADLSKVFWSAVRLAVYAALAAAIIQMVRKPDNILPPAPELTPDYVASTQEALKRAATGAGSTLQLSESHVNSYLAAQLKPADNTNPAPYRIEFVRVYSLIGQKEIRLVMERAIRSYPIFLAIDLQPVVRGSGSELEITGGQIGRLPLPAPLARLLGRSFAGMKAPLAYELQSLSAASKVELSDHRALVTFPAAGRPNP
jgi:hypothetical protein